MENKIKLSKNEIMDEVKRTGILHEHYFSPATVELIHSYYEDEVLAGGYSLTEPHLIAFFRLMLETSEEYPRDDREIINLLYESSVETLKVNNGHVELFANHSLLHYRGDYAEYPKYASPCFTNEYVDMNIESVRIAHDNQYLNPKNLTEADRNEIYIASLAPLRFLYESDLRTIHPTNEYYRERSWARTLTLKRPKPVHQSIVWATIGKLDTTYFSEGGAEIIKNVAFQNLYIDLNEFLQIQSALHLLERKFLKCLQEPEFAGKVEPLKNDLLKIQAFKDPSADIDQIIYPETEILVFSDQSVLFAPEAEEPEMYLDIHQFVMARLKYLQSVYFNYDLNNWEPDSGLLSSQFSRYGIEFSLEDGRIVTTFTRKFKTKLFNGANVRLA
jgi:hypothetical protein